MTSIAEGIESLLAGFNAQSTTSAIVLILLIIFLVSIYNARSGKYLALVNYTPNLLTSLGILGTFIGIVVGLLGFDVQDIDGSIAPLLDGLKTAFITSLVGMLLAIIFKAIDTSGKLRPAEEGPAEDEIGPQTILAVLEEQRQSLDHLTNAIVGDEESTLITQIRLLRSDHQDQARALQDQIKEQQQRFENFQEKLWRRMSDFAEMLSKSATEQVIQALQEVIHDFNQNLTEQFGDNFKQLNAAVERLVDWQENYRHQLENMTKQYQLGVESLTHTEQSVQTISNECKAIPEAMNNLQELLETTRRQLAELESHLHAFAAMRERAVEAVPEIHKQIELTLESVSNAGDQISGAGEAAKQEIVTGVENFRTQMEASNTSLREAADALTEGSKSVGQNIREVNQQLTDEVSALHDHVSKSIDEIQQQCQTSIERTYTDIANKSANLSQSVEEELVKSIGQFRESINKQLEAIDSELSQAIQNVMNQMAEALGGISNQLVTDYQRLRDADIPRPTQ